MDRREKPSQKQSNAQPDDLMLLMQRLRTLQLRLNSVDPVAGQKAEERVLHWRAFLGETEAREMRRQKLHDLVASTVADLRADFGARFESQYLNRVAASVESMIPEVERRAGTVSGMKVMQLEDEFTSRLSSLERRHAASGAQLAELRAACADTYVRFSEVNSRLDEIFEDRDEEGLGGWRTAIRTARKQKEENDKTPYQVFMETSIVDEESEVEQPLKLGMTCPNCGEATGRRKHRKSFLEDVMSLVGVAPYWCERCMVRYYRVRPARRRRRSKSV